MYNFSFIFVLLMEKFEGFVNVKSMHIFCSCQLGSEPKYEDYAFATRHGGRDIQAQGKSDIGTRFKFPTQVSSYG